MKALILGLAATLTLPAFAAPLATSFELKKRGDYVCRLQESKVEECLRTVESMSEFGHQPDGYELVDQLVKWKEVQPKLSAPEGQKPDFTLAQIGGAFLIDSAKADLITKTFSRLSVRNLANRLDKNEKIIPFFASIYWKSSSFPYANGTIHIEGALDLSNGLNLNLNDTPSVRQQIENVIQVKGITDSNTEADISALRFFESTGRAVTFRVIGTEGQSTDEKTVALIREVAGPMIFSQIVITPAAEQMADQVAKSLAESLSKALEQGLKGAIQNNSK